MLFFRSIETHRAATAAAPSANRQALGHSGFSKRKGAKSTQVTLWQSIFHYQSVIVGMSFHFRFLAADSKSCIWAEPLGWESNFLPRIFLRFGLLGKPTPSQVLRPYSMLQIHFQLRHVIPCRASQKEPVNVYEHTKHSSHLSWSHLKGQAGCSSDSFRCGSIGHGRRMWLTMTAHFAFTLRLVRLETLSQRTKLWGNHTWSRRKAQLTNVQHTHEAWKASKMHTLCLHIPFMNLTI